MECSTKSNWKQNRSILIESQNDLIWGSLSLLTSVIRKVCACFPGSVLRPVTPFRGDRRRSAGPARGSAGIHVASLFSPRLLIKNDFDPPQQITPKCKITIQKMVSGEVQHQFCKSNLDQPSVQKVLPNHSKFKITVKKLVFGGVQGPILHQ